MQTPTATGASEDAAARATAPWWKRLAVALAVTGLVWAVVITVWRASDTRPLAADLFWWLLMLPLALLLGLHLLRTGIARRRQRSAAAPAGSDIAQPPSERVDAAGDTACLHLHAHAMRVCIGSSADEAWTAMPLAARPGLHADLRDSYGFPVFAAPVADVEYEVDAVRDALHAIAPDDAVEQWDDELLRAFALLEPVTVELLQADFVARFAGDAEAPRDDTALPGYVYAHSRSVRASPTTARPLLHVHLLLPAQWPVRTRELAAARLHSTAHDLGYEAADFELHEMSVARVGDVWRLLERIRLEPPRVAGDRTLVIAAQSFIGARSVEQFEYDERLFRSAQPDGRIPGEAAAGLLFGAGPGDALGGAVQLHRLCEDRASREGRGNRAAIGATAALCERALAAARQPADRICALVSDADQRSSRAVEAAGALAAAFPGLEPDVHGAHIGIACGDIGVAAPAVLIALASARATRAQAPVLLLSVAEDAARIAFVITPSTVPPAETEDSIAATPSTRM